MTDKKDGYKPITGKKGYQPKPTPQTGNGGRGNVSGGYQPSKSKGDNPANKPPKKP